MNYIADTKIVGEFVLVSTSDPSFKYYTIELSLPEDHLFAEQNKLCQTLSAAGYDPGRLDVLGLAIGVLVNGLHDLAKKHGIHVYYDELYRCDEDVNWHPFDGFFVKPNFHFEKKADAEKFKTLIG